MKAGVVYLAEIKFCNQGESGLVVEFGTSIDPAINAAVHRIAGRLRQELPKGIDAVVPTYRSLMIYFDPLVISRAELKQAVEKIQASLSGPATGEKEGRKVIIPTCYGGEFGPDLSFVASHAGLEPDEVIRIHSSTAYKLYMIGFTPGFPYLGGMSEKIATPRLEKPRTCIPAGSVGIAGTQTGLYPMESPGGWQLIGRTPLKVFNPEAADPFLYVAGDYLQFEPVSSVEYAAIETAVAAGTYQPKILPLEQLAGGEGA